MTAKQESIINKRTARIGFIGLGLMGSRLTRRLHSLGWDVQAWNRSPDPAKSLARDGVALSSSVAKLVADSEEKIDNQFHLDAGRTGPDQEPLFRDGFVDGGAFLEGILVAAGE